MVIVGLLSWWYTVGWRQRLTFMHDKLVSQYDFFSFDLLLKTLFSPFRQISAGGVNGPIAVQLRAFADQMVSRLVGATVRTIVLLVGVVTLICSLVWNALVVLLWGVIPLLPIVGVVLAMSGWIPWQI